MLLLAALMAFLVALTGCVWVIILSMMMVGEINRKKGDNEQIAYLGYGPTKMFRILAEYRMLYPLGRLHIYTRIFLLVMYVFFAVAAVLVIMAKP